MSERGSDAAGSATTRPAIDPPVPVDAAVATTDAAADAPVARTATAPKLPKTTDVDALTRTFGKQSPAITACFKQHPGTSEQISVRIQIDTRGVVKAAEVLPPSVDATPLGACIAAVARKTAFGAQPKPAAFRVPLDRSEL